MSDTVATLLLLTDARLPAGGHAHSGGLEAAVVAGRVRDLDDLASFLRGRLATAGRVAAAFAAAACARPDETPILDIGLDARTPSSAQRRTSRAQGRALLRVGRAMWPQLVLTAHLRHEGPHQPVALGIVGAAAGATPCQVGTAAAYGAVAGPASAATRLLGVDPYQVHAVLATLAPACDALGAAAADRAHDPVEELPAASAPLLDLYAESHADWEVRLFAS